MGTVPQKWTLTEGAVSCLEEVTMEISRANKKHLGWYMGMTFYMVVDREPDDVQKKPAMTLFQVGLESLKDLRKHQYATPQESSQDRA
jgi:hypothetical protein